MKGMLASEQTQEMQECLICKQEKGYGIQVLHYFICESCEQELVNTDTKEEAYNEYVHRLRKVRDSLFQNRRPIH
ncbi:sigma factor G inhibitor Gin [Alteribacter natronophilus]|uniref:sigma factor G inhibitor Gin n=1 Tax=Alteribacter natronophilus TaxID=2583810 RepID=UPI00110E5CDF|nr:sigma factor G inhibitor Gin [Alteribacter natronophilus]TMW69979.1 inhibitor of sigma-G Gin [Alteribacter natronophilus]